VASPAFVVRVSDLEDGPKEVSFDISEDWLREALAETGAAPRGGPGRFTAELMKNGREVMVRGKAHVEVTVPCVVTLDPLPFDLDPEVFLLLRPEPGSDRKKKAGAVDAEKRPPKPKKRKEEEPELTPEEVAADTYSGDEVVLDAFLREFIVLEIPPYPRRSDLPSPEEGISSRPLAGASEERPIDPRLAPLAGIAQKLRREGIKE